MVRGRTKKRNKELMGVLNSGKGRRKANACSARRKRPGDKPTSRGCTGFVKKRKFRRGKGSLETRSGKSFTAKS